MNISDFLKIYKILINWFQTFVSKLQINRERSDFIISNENCYYFTITRREQ